MHALQEIGFPRLRPGLGLDVGKRQEGGLGADEKQPRVLLGEDLLQRTLDGVEIGRGLRRADPSDGEGLRRRQRRLRIAPQVHHGRNARHRRGPGVFRPTLQELVGDDDEIGAPGHALELLAEGPAHQGIGGAAVAQVPGIIEIDDQGKPTEHGSRHPPRHPRQDLLFDPDDVEFSRLDQIVQALGIEGKDAPERRAASVIELFQVDIVQEWSRVDDNLVFVQAGEILLKAQSAACAGGAITR